MKTQKQEDCVEKDKKGFSAHPTGHHVSSFTYTIAFQTVYQSKSLVTLKCVAPSDVTWNRCHASHRLKEKKKERVPMGGMKLILNDIWWHHTFLCNQALRGRSYHMTEVANSSLLSRLPLKHLKESKTGLPRRSLQTTIVRFFLLMNFWKI